jgi:hypothetical protein
MPSSHPDSNALDYLLPLGCGGVALLILIAGVMAIIQAISVRQRLLRSDSLSLKEINNENFGQCERCGARAPGKTYTFYYGKKTGTAITPVLIPGTAAGIYKETSYRLDGPKSTRICYMCMREDSTSTLLSIGMPYVLIGFGVLVFSCITLRNSVPALAVSLTIGAVLLILGIAGIKNGADVNRAAKQGNPNAKLITIRVWDDAEGDLAAISQYRSALEKQGYNAFFTRAEYETLQRKG